jgi:hypothetical protein
MRDKDNLIDSLKIQMNLPNPPICDKQLEHHHHHRLETKMTIMENHGIEEIILLGIMVVVAASGVEEEDLEVVEIIFQTKIETMTMIRMHPPTLEEDLEVVEDPQMIQMMVNMMIANLRTLKGSLTMLIGLLMAYIIALNHQHLIRK